MPDSMSVLGRVVLEFIKMGVAFDNGGILAVNPTPARSANASSQTKSFINASLPIFHFPLIFQVGSQRAELEFIPYCSGNGISSVIGVINICIKSGKTIVCQSS